MFTLKKARNAQSFNIQMTFHFSLPPQHSLSTELHCLKYQITLYGPNKLKDTYKVIELNRPTEEYLI